MLTPEEKRLIDEHMAAEGVTKCKPAPAYVFTRYYELMQLSPAIADPWSDDRNWKKSMKGFLFKKGEGK